MKEWFKYEYGYVNIDSDNLYFTNSGNWSEVEGLKEKGIQKSTNSRRTRIQVFMTLSGLLFAYILYRNLLSNRISIILIVGIPLAIYFLYDYLKSEIGSKYKLPLAKITEIEIEKNDATIRFLNSQGEQNEEILKKVEAKGIKILNNLQRISE